MSPARRWKAWLAGYALIGVAFALAWWNNPANIGGVREAQRVWLGVGYAIPGMLVLLPPLVTRPANEPTAQRTLIEVLAVYLAIVLWWVGFLPADPFGCSRVNAPDCHTNEVTRWRAFGEVSAAWVVAFVAAHFIGSAIARQRAAKGMP